MDGEGLREEWMVAQFSSNHFKMKHKMIIELLVLGEIFFFILLMYSLLSFYARRVTFLSFVNLSSIICFHIF